jgi:hypothetical protein
VVDHPSLAGRPVRWVLHAMGRALVPLAPDDPAALAFCGLPPAERPPSEGESPASDDEARAIRESAERIAVTLVERLRMPNDGTRRRSGVLRRVCIRPGQIVADPGWIDVRLPIQEVSSEIRRAGLDLDLGYLPWLGTVVRFIYE